MFGKLDVHVRALTYVTYIAVAFAILYGVFYIAIVNDAVNLFISGFFIAILASVSYLMIYLIADMNITDEEIKKKHGKDAFYPRREYKYKSYTTPYTYETHTVTVTNTAPSANN